MCTHCIHILHVQIFDIVLNKRHKVVSNLDIFAKVGKAIAHDEVTRFTIENGQLLVGDQVSDFDGTLTVEFSKVRIDVGGHLVWWEYMYNIIIDVSLSTIHNCVSMFDQSANSFMYREAQIIQR